MTERQILDHDIGAVMSTIAAATVDPTMINNELLEHWYSVLQRARLALDGGIALQELQKENERLKRNQKAASGYQNWDRGMTSAGCPK